MLVSSCYCCFFTAMRRFFATALATTFLLLIHIGERAYQQFMITLFRSERRLLGLFFGAWKVFLAKINQTLSVIQSKAKDLIHVSSSYCCFSIAMRKFFATYLATALSLLIHIGERTYQLFLDTLICSERRLSSYLGRLKYFLFLSYFLL